MMFCFLQWRELCSEFCVQIRKFKNFNPGNIPFITTLKWPPKMCKHFISCLLSVSKDFCQFNGLRLLTAI
uniref:Uncharacterized protein n=1 Tax=Anguilla anguilla TaxID=7936 RepID=A0A0E9WTB2_ANGAN